MKEAGVQVVQISIDGADLKTHDSFRGEDGAFDKAMNGVKACREAKLPFQFGMVIRRSTVPQMPDMLKMAVDSGANAAELFDLVQVSRVKQQCEDELLSKDERKRVMEWLAETQRNCPIVIRVPACPMYTLILREQRIGPKHFSLETLRRIPLLWSWVRRWHAQCNITILANGDVMPCMLLQVRISNVRKDDVIDLWQNSPVLKMLRSRSLLKGACGSCKERDVCAGCRGRAYDEVSDILAPDPGCWLA
jgi:radical SAM protein with 4Fe4S-binding SPASM domain